MRAGEMGREVAVVRANGNGRAGGAADHFQLGAWMPQSPAPLMLFMAV